MVKGRKETEEYDVEALLDMRRINGKAYYLVKWTGYAEDEATWEPLSNLSGSLPLVRKFHEKQEKTPQIAQKHLKREQKVGKSMKEAVLEEWFLFIESKNRPSAEGLHTERVAKVVRHSRNALGELQFEVQWEEGRENSELSLQDMEKSDPKRLIEYFASIV